MSKGLNTQPRQPTPPQIRSPTVSRLRSPPADPSFNGSRSFVTLVMRCLWAGHTKCISAAESSIMVRCLLCCSRASELWRSHRHLVSNDVTCRSCERRKPCLARNGRSFGRQDVVSLANAVALSDLALVSSCRGAGEGRPGGNASAIDEDALGRHCDLHRGLRARLGAVCASYNDLSRSLCHLCLLFRSGFCVKKTTLAASRTSSFGLMSARYLPTAPLLSPLAPLDVAAELSLRSCRRPSQSSLPPCVRSTGEVSLGRSVPASQ